MIQITKRLDGAGVLKCIRVDGTSTWQKKNERHSAHFALHDLTHFAVETTLGYRNGFFGLVEQGWDMNDVTGKGSRGILPAEAPEVESIVGLFDAERASGGMWTTDEFNNFASMRLAEGQPARLLSTEEISRIKARRSELFQRWSAIPIGQVLELLFEAPGKAAMR
jgi:hypothetical protein